jgi:hypothetical protein
LHIFLKRIRECSVGWYNNGRRRIVAIERGGYVVLCFCNKIKIIWSHVWLPASFGRNTTQYQCNGLVPPWPASFCFW